MPGVSPHPAIEVAKAVVAFCNEHGDFVSNLKLQKILYYVQGWHLAYHGDVLFPEHMEAWIHGPVCPDVYHAYKGSGYQPITQDVDIESFDKSLVEHIGDVWSAYGHMSAFDLERLSHQEAPWLNARRGLRLDEPSRATISVDDMLAFFKSEAAKDGA